MLAMNPLNAPQISVRSMLDSDALGSKFQLPGRKQLPLSSNMSDRKTSPI